MDVACPKCSTRLAMDDVNVATDVALCRRCNQVFSFAELLAEQKIPAVNLTQPPKGTWFQKSSRGFEAGVSTRHPMALFLVPFMCVWSGGSLGGIYGSQIIKGKFDLFQSLFGIPFFLGTLLFGSIALMSVCGKAVLRVESGNGEAFIGVGPIGWRRRFKWSEITAIREQAKYNKGSPSREIVLEGKKTIRFISGLNDERTDFLLGALRQMLKSRG